MSVCSTAPRLRMRVASPSHQFAWCQAEPCDRVTLVGERRARLVWQRAHGLLRVLHRGEQCGEHVIELPLRPRRDLERGAVELAGHVAGDGLAPGLQVVEAGCGGRDLGSECRVPRRGAGKRQHDDQDPEAVTTVNAGGSGDTESGMRRPSPLH